ncbi:OmpA family protein [Magnetococcales bacterium HHB-1]
MFDRRILFYGLFFTLLLIQPLSVFAQCSQQRAIHLQSHTEIQIKKLLQRCPNQRYAWNRLGDIYTDQNRLNQAVDAYQHALKGDPQFTIAYAGLADALSALDKHPEAAQAYQQFINGLDLEAQRGDPDGLLQYQSIYQRRLRKSAQHAGITLASHITRALTTQTRSIRGVVPVYHQPAKIDIPILFDFASDHLTEAAQVQVGQIAQSLQSPQLKDKTIQLIGHTDHIGSAAKNLQLSLRRANRIKNTLIQEGISASRLKTKGKGESEPIADNHTAHGRQQNRRVTLVNMGSE